MDKKRKKERKKTGRIEMNAHISLPVAGFIQQWISDHIATLAEYPTTCSTMLMKYIPTLRRHMAAPVLPVLMRVAQQALLRMPLWDCEQRIKF